MAVYPIRFLVTCATFWAITDATPPGCNPRMPGCFVISAYESEDGTCTDRRAESLTIAADVNVDCGQNGTVSCNYDGTVTVGACGAQAGDVWELTLRPTFAGSCSTLRATNEIDESRSVDVLIRGICPLNAVREPVSSGSSRAATAMVAVAGGFGAIIVISGLALSLQPTQTRFETIPEYYL